MKKLLLIFLFFVSVAAAKAQDKIITIKKDTIDCQIISVGAERIVYEQKTSDNLVSGKSIAISEVLTYSRTGEADNYNERFEHKRTRREPPAHRWLFSLQSGLAHSLTDYDDSKKFLVQAGNSTASADDYFGKLVNGYHVNASVHYLLSSYVGLGLDYNLFYAASKADFLTKEYGQANVPVYVKLGVDDKVYTHFAGISVLFQQVAGKIKISETITPGMFLLRNESRNSYYQTYWSDGYGGGYGGTSSSYYGQANGLTTGTNFGAKGSLAIEYALTPQLSAGLAGNFVWAELHKITSKSAISELEDQELENPIKLSHIDYGLIVRYNF